jgi:hypothetical protein
VLEEAQAALRARGCSINDKGDVSGSTSEQEAQYESVRANVEAVRSAVRLPRKALPSAGDIEFTQTKVHAAEAALLPLLTRKQFWAELPRIQRSIHDYLSEDDPRRAWVDRCLMGRMQRCGWRSCHPIRHGITARERARLTSALRWAYYVNSIDRGRLWSFQRMLMRTAGALGMVLVALALVQGYVWPDTLSVCFFNSEGGNVCPSGPKPKVGDIAVVEVVGLVGGTLAAVRAIASSRRVVDPYAVHVAQALLKAAAGGVTAVLGIMLLSASNLQVSNPVQILAFAVVFGYSQELVTHIISTKEEALLNSALPRGAGVG